MCFEGWCWYNACMRKLIVQQWATVDTIVAETDGGLSFIPAQSFTESPEDTKANAMEFINSVDTMILGAKTYAMFKEYWPTADNEGEFATKLNNLTKLVASKKLEEAPWGSFPAATVTRDPIATIQELKQQPGKDIVLWGSLSLMWTMLNADIVDEIQLRVCPTSRGEGTYMFKDRRDMSLIGVQPFENGVVLLRYNLISKTVKDSASRSQ